MEIVIDFFKKKRISFYFIVAAIAFILTSLIIYIATGTDDKFTEMLSGEVIALWVIALLLSCLSLWKEFQILSFGIYILTFLGFLEFTLGKMDLISNVLVGIDNAQFPLSFICTVLFSALTWICMLVSAIILTISERKSKKRNAMQLTEKLSAEQGR